MEFGNYQRNIVKRFLYRHPPSRQIPPQRINGDEVKQHETDHIVFENNHTPIVDYKVFALAQENLKNVPHLIIVA